jgi:formylglycine-generating enzyme required for sulfatase activity/uncharacterized caspase-like protein
MRIRTILLLLTVLVGPISPATAEVRVALVIGNGAYANAPQLPNPRNDAQDVAESLKRSGFETILGLDWDRAQMEDAEARFSRAARTADVAMFYYSGHAVQFGGVNYLAPVDIKLTDESDLRRMIKLDDIVSDVEKAKNLRVIVLDSCRDNPLANELKRSIGTTRALPLQQGLAKIDTPQGMIIAYATQAGRTAEDGSGRNSPYTRSFLKHIEEPEEIGTVFRRVSADVFASTGQTQLPELSLSFIGEFYLRGKAAITLQPSVDPCSEASDHWKSADAIGTVASYEDHVSRFPTCAFASLAREKIRLLEPTVAAITPPVILPLPAKTADVPAAEKPCGDSPLAVSTKTDCAYPLSAKREKSLGQKTVFKECEKCPNMVVVPAGAFTMGFTKGHSSGFAQKNEIPLHIVTFSESFAVGTAAVTVGEFAEFAKETGYMAADDCFNQKLDMSGDSEKGKSWKSPGFDQTDQHPVVCVSWKDAKAYVQWLSSKTSKPYRLVSEAEWEYAARARTKPGKYPSFFYGDDENVLCRYDNVPDETARRTYDATKDAWQNFVTCSDGYVFTSPVRSFAPNDFGVFDLQGNVQQWVEDCLNTNYNGAPANGGAWLTGSCLERQIRGGGWNINAMGGTLSGRSALPADFRQNVLGFRVARSLLH